MKHTTTGELVDYLIHAARQAEKSRLIVTLHPIGTNATANRVAERKLKHSKEMLNRHLRECIKLVQSEWRKKNPAKKDKLKKRGKPA